MRRWFQHKFNSAHVYCFLRSLGINKLASKRLALMWERMTVEILYPVSKVSIKKG